MAGPTITSPSMAFLGIPYPQHSSGKSKVTSYLFPGALQPQITSGGPAQTSPSMAFLGINYPQHSSGKSSVRSFLFPGALQPQIPAIVVLADVAGWVENEWG